MKLPRSVQREILNTVGAFPPECGGILASNRQGVLADFYFDQAAGTGNQCYAPTREAIQRKVNQNWRPEGLSFAGTVHSHPHDSLIKPSRADLEATQEILRLNGLRSALLMIVYQKALFAWTVFPDGSMERCELALWDEPNG